MEFEGRSSDRIVGGVNVKRDIERKLMEIGELEKLKELLRTRLVECGWRDQMRAHCKASIWNIIAKTYNNVAWVLHCIITSNTDVIREKGVEEVKIDELVIEITPKGRELVPDSVKKDLLEKIRSIIYH